MLLDAAVLATLCGAPVNDVARGVRRKHGMTAVRIEHVSTLDGSKRIEQLGGTTLATQRGPWPADIHAVFSDTFGFSDTGVG